MGLDRGTAWIQRLRVADDIRANPATEIHEGLRPMTVSVMRTESLRVSLGRTSSMTVHRKAAH
jgi:hypothetical protein